MLGACQPATATSTDATITTSGSATTGSESTATSTDSGKPDDDAETSGSSADDDTTSSGAPEVGSTRASDSSASSGGGPQCPRSLAFEPVVPTVVLVIDQSLSMQEPFTDSTRWDTLKGALMDPVDGIVPNLQDELRFGITFYTNDGLSECPQLEEVAPAIMNFERIAELYDRLYPAHQTPTGDSLTMVTNALLADPFPGPKTIVLATDGEPDTCEQPDPNEGQEESIAAARGAFAAGIPTYVIAVGLDISLQHLQDLANAGAGIEPPEAVLAVAAAEDEGTGSSTAGDEGGTSGSGSDTDGTGGESSTGGEPGPEGENAEYYVTEDREELVVAFQAIIGEVRQCSYVLAESIVPGRGTGTVTLNGDVLPFNGNHGWRIHGSNRIELVGNACEAVRAGPVELSIAFDCAALGED